MNVFDLFAKLTLDTSEYDKNLSTAEKQASSFGDSFAAGTKSIATGAGILAGVGAAAYKFADGVSQDLDQIDKMSQKLGMSTQAYQEWDYVLKISGTEMSSMSTGLKTLTNKFDDAVNGSDSAVETFNKLGLSMEDIQSLSREDLFATVITAFQGMEDSAERAALANDLFGKSGQELAPLFNTTTEETQALIQQVNDLGGVMSEGAVKNGAAFQDSLTALKASFSGASSGLMAELIPATTSLMDKVTEFISSGGLDKIINLLKILAPVVGAVVAGIAGFKIITGVITLIQGLSAVFGVLNVIMLANPIGLVIAAITALIAIGVLLYKNWDEIVAKLKEFWGNIKEFFGKIKEFIISAVTNAVEAVKNKFNEMKEKVKEIFTNILDKAKTWGKDLIDNFVQGIKDKIQAVKDAVSNIANTVRDFLGFSEPEEGPLSNFHTYAPDMMQLFAKGVKDNNQMLTDTVADAFDFGGVIAGDSAAMTQSGYGLNAGNNGGIIEAVVNALQGITVEVNIGAERIDGVVTKAIQRSNYRSGGR